MDPERTPDEHAAEIASDEHYRVVHAEIRTMMRMYERAIHDPDVTPEATGALMESVYEYLQEQLTYSDMSRCLIMAWVAEDTRATSVQRRRSVDPNDASWIKDVVRHLRDEARGA